MSNEQSKYGVPLHSTEIDFLKIPHCFQLQPFKASTMTDHHETRDGKPNKNLPQPSSEKFPIGSSDSGFSSGPKYPNPPETTNPDPATLREQWRYATRQYSRWYSQAWGTAILAGLSFFALGWIIKGSNPLPSFKSENVEKKDDKSSPEQAKQG